MLQACENGQVKLPKRLNRGVGQTYNNAKAQKDMAEKNAREERDRKDAERRARDAELK